nr:hypothetical protein [Tanacetum cinerariifolium]
MEAYDPEAPLSPVHALEYPKYLTSSDDDIAPTEDQPLPTSPIALSPGYISNSKPIEDGLKEDPEMDPVYYVTTGEEEKSSKDEEEHLALADSTLSVPDFVPSGMKDCPSQPPLPTSIEARIVEYDVSPTPSSPLPSPLTPLSSPLPRIASPPLLLPSPAHRDIILEVDMPLQKTARFTTPL